MMQSESISDLAAALAKFQADMPPVGKSARVKVKTKSGGEYAFNYAPLSAITDAIRPGLAANGLAYVQMVSDAERGVAIETVLMHQSGQWISGRFTMPASGGPQEIGSAITYARRYALTAMLGIVADEDDDGNAAAGNSYQRQERPRQRKETPSNGSGDKPFYAAVVKETPWFGDEQAVEDTMVLLGLGYPSRADEARSHRALLAQYAQLVADGKTQAEAVATLTVPKAA